MSYINTSYQKYRAAGGWSIAEQVPVGNGTVGVDWESTLGVENSPSESELNSTLTGWSAGFDGGFFYRWWYKFNLRQ